MRGDDLNQLLNTIENPRRFSKAECAVAREKLLRHGDEILEHLHTRVRGWIEDFNSPDIKKIDDRCKADAKKLREQLGSSDHPEFLAKWSGLESVRARNALDIREAAAMAVIELIGEIGNPDSVPLLREVIHGPWRNDMTWFTAAAALIKLGDPQGISFMKEHIMNESATPGLRRSCCRKLCELGVTGIFQPEDVIPGDSALAAALEEEYMKYLRRA